MHTERLFYHSDGVRFSITPRCRDLEVSTADIHDPDGLANDLKDNGAMVQYYVVSANRKGLTPDAGIRPPRESFLRQNAIIGTTTLSGEEGSALADIVTVTGPYVSGESTKDEWHGMMLITKNDAHVPTYAELSVGELAGLQGMIGKALRFMERPGVDGFVGLSFSPDEQQRRILIHRQKDRLKAEILFPRSPVQNIRTIHAHLVMVDRDSLKSDPVSPRERFNAYMTNEPMLGGTLGIFRHMVYEPLLAQYDCVQAYHEHIENDASYPKGALLVVDREQIGSATFAGFMRDLVIRGHAVHRAIASHYVDMAKYDQGILKMLPKQQIEVNVESSLGSGPFSLLPPQSKRFFRLLARLEDPRKMINPDMPISAIARQVERFVMMGAAYNLVYYIPKRQPESIVVGVVPRWISGASPIETMGIFKDQQPVSIDDFSRVAGKYQEIGQSFADFLGNGEEGGSVFR